MCGIFGCVGDHAVKQSILGLEKLEYRGYDSAGIAYINENEKYIINKKIGRIQKLKSNLDLEVESEVAIAHTRWATHGKPSEKNSHPHYSGNFILVHNGIIENYKELKKYLLKNDKNIEFYSDTDSEIIVKLLDYYFTKENDKNLDKNILNAIKKINNKMVGSWALAIINKSCKNKIFITKNASPLVVAKNRYNSYISSDLTALACGKNKAYILNNYEIGIIEKNDIKIYNNKLEKLKINYFNINTKQSENQNKFKHFMLKEIHEIPNAINNTKNIFKFNNDFCENFLNYNNITIIGCGTAYHAGLYMKYLCEKILSKKIDVQLSSEFRYAPQLHTKTDLIFAISQSGETADTIAGLCIAKENGLSTAVITNVETSTVTGMADYVFLTNAGIESAVAATKTYIAQLYLISQLVKSVAEKNNIDFQLDDEEIGEAINVLLQQYADESIYKKYFNKNKYLFIGRACDAYTAMEGSLKLKEICYLHSEGYPAGELKHGTLSLVDENTLVIAIVTQENIKNKTLNAVHETKCRGAETLIVTQFKELESEGDVFLLPSLPETAMPLLSVIPLQLFAYYLSLHKGNDPDKPRNLAKSVTVE